jgi:membrane associated rhomboid family serine protease
MRTICPECQTQAAVGVICPECMKAQRAETPKAVRRARSSVRAISGRPLVTYWIVGVTVALFVLDFIPGLNLTGFFFFNSVYLVPDGWYGFQPWRLFTDMLAHDGIWHVGLNMLAVWMIGRSLEPLLGHVRFLLLYLLSGLAGSVAVALLAPETSVIGASGAVFGLLGALLVIGRHIGANITGILIIVGINLVIGFLPGFSISWQAHVGGLAAGALAGLIFARTRRADQRGLQYGLLAGLAVVLLALCAVPALVS